MYYRCIRFNTNQEKNQVRDTILLEQKDLSVLKTGAPDSVRCSRPYNSKLATLGNSIARSAIIHRTVRWANGATTICVNGRLCTDEQYAKVPHRSQSSEVRGAPDCPVPQEDKAPKVYQAPNPNGWVTWRRTEQGTVPIRCAHRQQPPQRLLRWLGAINTTNHHNLWNSSFSEITFNTRASAFTPRHISKDQTLSNSRIHLSHLVTWESVFVFFCALVSWIVFLIFPFLFSSAL
jgi:hypothetical protein